jgi:Phage Mu protein F like protein
MPADAAIKRGPVPSDVLAFWKAKHLKPSFDYREVWGSEHDAAFTAAKVLRLDALKTLQNGIERALAEGHDFATFKREIQPHLENAGWWDEHEVTDPETGDEVTVNPPKRLKLIFDTNVRVSRAIGQWDRIQQEKKRRPYLLYGIGPSVRHREQHVTWAGLLLPVDDPFWTYAFPPNGFGCRCHTRSVDPREYAKLVREGTLAGPPEPVLDDEGRPTGHIVQRRVPVILKAPHVPLVPWTNKRTGEVKLVREGIGPGFDRLPGAGRAQTLEAQKKRLRSEAQKTRKPASRGRTVG